MINVKKNRSDFKNECKKLTIVGIGIALGQLSQVLMGLSDVSMISVLGRNPLAGGTLVSSLNLLASLFSMGFILVIPPLIGVAKGENNSKKVSDIMKNAYIISICIALLQSIYLACMPSVLKLIVNDGDLISIVSEYAYGLIIGILPWTIFMLVRLVLAVYGDIVFSSIVSLVGVLVNIIGNYLLIYNNRLFHGLGVFGSALSTSITNWVMLIIILIYIKYSFQKVNAKVLLASMGEISRDIIFKILKLGIPSGFTFFSEQLIFTGTSILISKFSSTSLASYNVALQWLNIFYMFPVGLSNAAAMRVGESIGERSQINIKRVIKSTFFLFFTYSAMIVGLIASQSYKLISMIVENSIENQEIIQVASQFMYWIAVIFILNSSIAIVAGILRGYEETKAPLFLIFLMYWVFGIGSSLIFSIFLKETGIFVGMILGLLLTSIGMYFSLVSKMKKSANVFDKVEIES